MDYSQMSDEQVQAAYAQERQDARAQNRKEAFETALDAVSGFAQGATFSLGDEIYSANRALTDYIANGFSTDIVEDYNKYHEAEQMRIQMTQDRSPVAYNTAELASMAPFFGKIATTKAPALTKVGQYFTAGYTNGYGSGDGGTGAFQDAVVHGVASSVGALFPTSGTGAGTSTMRVIEKLLPKKLGASKVLKTGGEMLKDNPVKAGLGFAGASAVAGQPVGTAIGLGSAGMAVVGNAAKAMPELSGLSGMALEKSLDIVEPGQPVDYSAMSDEELQELFWAEEQAEIDYSSMTDEELLQIVNE